MTWNRIRYLPILDGGTLKGPISIWDVVKALLEATEFANRYLRIQPTIEAGVMKFQKIDEWENHRIEPGGDEIFLLEIVDAPTDSPRYMRMSCAELTDQEFDALEQSAVFEMQHPNESR